MTERTPSTTNAPSELPEAQRAIESLWERLIDANTGSITHNTRGLLEEVLSKEKIGELLTKGRHSGSKKTPIMKRSGMGAILSELAKSGAGMIPVIQKRMAKKLEDQGVTTVDQFEIPASKTGAPEIMENLVRDPDSQEAMALACFYDDIVKSTGAFAYYADVFDAVDESEARNAETMKMAQELYKDITSNKSYLGIGKDPAGGVVGNGKLKQLRDEVAQYDAAIIASGKSKTTKYGVTKGDPEPYIKLKKESEAKIDALIGAKSELEGKLTQLNSHIQALTATNLGGGAVKIVPITNVSALATNFSVAAFNTQITKTPPHVDNSYIELAGTTKTVREWLIDKDLAVTANQAITQFRQAGPGLVPAGMAYQKFMQKTVGTAIGLSPEHNVQMVQQVTGRSLSKTTSAEPAAKGPGLLKRVFFGGKHHAEHAAEKGKSGLSKLWGYLWEKI